MPAEGSLFETGKKHMRSSKKLIFTYLQCWLLNRVCVLHFLQYGNGLERCTQCIPISTVPDNPKLHEPVIIYNPFSTRPRTSSTSQCSWKKSYTLVVSIGKILVCSRLVAKPNFCIYFAKMKKKCENPETIIGLCASYLETNDQIFKTFSWNNFILVVV